MAKAEKKSGWIVPNVKCSDLTRTSSGEYTAGFSFSMCVIGTSTSGKTRFIVDFLTNAFVNLCFVFHMRLKDDSIYSVRRVFFFSYVDYETSSDAHHCDNIQRLRTYMEDQNIHFILVLFQKHGLSSYHSIKDYIVHKLHCDNCRNDEYVCDNSDFDEKKRFFFSDTTLFVLDDVQPGVKQKKDVQYLAEIFQLYVHHCAMSLIFTFHDPFSGNNMRIIPFINYFVFPKFEFDLIAKRVFKTPQYQVLFNDILANCKPNSKVIVDIKRRNCLSIELR